MDRSGEEAREDGILRNTERLATQHNLWAQRQEFKEQLTLFETRIDEQYEEVANNFTIVNQDMTLLQEATDNLNGQMAANDANMERRMDSLERAINNLGRRHRHRSTSSSSSSSQDYYSHGRHTSSSSNSRSQDLHQPHRRHDRHAHHGRDDQPHNNVILNMEPVPHREPRMDAQDQGHQDLPRRVMRTSLPHYYLRHCKMKMKLLSSSSPMKLGLDL